MQNAKVPETRLRLETFLRRRETAALQGLSNQLFAESQPVRLKVSDHSESQSLIPPIGGETETETRVLGRSKIQGSKSEAFRADVAAIVRWASPSSSTTTGGGRWVLRRPAADRGCRVGTFQLATKFEIH